MKKKNTFKEFGYNDRFKSFHNTIRHIDDNLIIDNNNDLSPTELLKIESGRRYAELKQMVNTRPSRSGNRVLRLYNKYRYIIISYVMLLCFTLYLAGLFSLVYLLFLKP